MLSSPRSRRLLGLALVVRAAASCEAAPCHSINSGIIATTPVDPPVICPVVIPTDTHAAERAACAFTAGASVAETLGISAALSRAIPIRHVVVLMQENRSFDHLFGRLHEQGQPAVEPIPRTFANNDLYDFRVTPYRADTTCLAANPSHQWAAMHAAVNGGAMDGFVGAAAVSTLSDGHVAMTYYTREELPFNYWLASTWALNDRHFASVRSGTTPNRAFLLLGTNDGIKQSGHRLPAASTPSILDGLAAQGFSYGIFSDGALLGGVARKTHDDSNCYCFDDFLAQLDNGTLPNVAFVDGVASLTNDHPDADLQAGEAYLRKIYEHAIRSPEWPRLALIWVYDEGGGFADHVPPPERACVARPTAADEPFFELGPRVPLVVISPYAKPSYVSHVSQDHTAITRFIEVVFALPALTARDANSTALLDLFDFSCAPPMLTPPRAPPAGTGGCVQVVASPLGDGS